MDNMGKTEDRIYDLEENAEAVTKIVSELEHYITGESNPTKLLTKEVKKLEKIKSEIIAYTLQLITIVVGIFALILTISMVSLNKSVLNDAAWVIWLDVIFIFILLTWFIFWLLKEDVLHWKLIKRDENIRYKKIISYIDNSIESSESHMTGCINDEISKLKKNKKDE